MMSHRAEDRYRPRSPDRRIVLISRDSTRTFTVRPWVAGLAGALVAALSVAYLGATAYLIFRDDLVHSVLARNANLQHAYEDRIANLRSEIDKIASRQLLDQVAFDDKVDRLLSAQKALDERTQLVTDLIDRARENGVLADAPDLPGSGDRADAVGYAPDGAGAIESHFAALTGDVAAKRSRSDGSIPLDDAGRPDLRVMSAGLSRIDRAQTEAVQAIVSATEARAEAVTRIVADLGITLKLPKPEATVGDGHGLGGPYIPLTSSEALTSALAEADSAFGMLGSLKSAVTRLPLRTPIPNAAMSSNFGSRSDPFLGSAAFHAGIDFRSPSGKPVHATAAGKVVAAGRNGGYGNLVEIDHGKGLTTRYAHLSRIDVKAGQTVAAGEVVGRVGSTGRSTGPHLHYETRVNGAAVNPHSYLRAGKRIASILP